MDVRTVAAQVRSAAEWRMDGVGRTRLREAVRLKELVVVHRGWYVRAAVWNGWHTESREVARAIATVRAMRGGELVISHTSAAALHGLPLFRYRPTRVHVVGPSTNGTVRSSASLARHCADVDGQIVRIDGIRVTSLARTVADLVGRLPLAAAVALADAAIRQVAWRESDKVYDPLVAEVFRAEVVDRQSLQPGARGCVQARWVMSFADGRAQLPGESVSRLYLHQLGFAPPRLQVSIAYPGGRYDADFGMDDVGQWGEFDGVGKYTDPAMLHGRTTAEAVLQEKHREDHIRGITKRGIIRWGSEHIKTVDALRARLAVFHVFPPGGPGRVPPSFRGAWL